MLIRKTFLRAKLLHLFFASLLFMLNLGAPSSQVFAQDAARDWYVQAGAANGGSGSRDDPFNTLAEIQAAAAPSDTLYLLQGLANATLNGGIVLQDSQKLLGVDQQGDLLVGAEDRVVLQNQTDQLDGIIVALARDNEVAGIHFQGMKNSAIAASNFNFSSTHLHHNSFSGNAEFTAGDERGLVYAIAFDLSAGEVADIHIHDSEFFAGEDLGAIRVFHSGESRGKYLFDGNTFADLGGRAYFVRTQHRSHVETIIRNSQADNIGRGERNSDSILPFLMGQSQQVMLIENYHYKNTNQEGNPSNTGIEAYMFGAPREDTANWCTACTLTMKIFDSVIENAVTDPIQFSNAGLNSTLHYEIRNTRILGGNPQQGGAGISLNLMLNSGGGGSTSLLVENTEVIGTTGFGFSLNNRAGDTSHRATIDFGGGVLGSVGGNVIRDNALGDRRIAPGFE